MLEQHPQYAFKQRKSLLPFVSPPLVDTYYDAANTGAYVQTSNGIPFNSESAINLSKLQISNVNYDNGKGYFDNIRVYKCTSVEPTTSVGDEEYAGPQDPVPELPTIILMGMGLTLIGGLFWLKELRGDIVGTS